MRILRLIAMGYLGAVAMVTLWPSPQSTQAPGWAEAVLGYAHQLGVPLSLPMLEAGANVVMFIPFGVLGVLLTGETFGHHPWWRHAGSIIIAALLCSSAIELSQLFIPGRFSTIQDVVMNTSGACVGAVAALWLRSHRHAIDEPAR